MWVLRVKTKTYMIKYLWSHTYSGTSGGRPGRCHPDQPCFRLLFTGKHLQCVQQLRHIQSRAERLVDVRDHLNNKNSSTWKFRRQRRVVVSVNCWRIKRCWVVACWSVPSMQYRLNAEGGSVARCFRPPKINGEEAEIWRNWRRRRGVKTSKLIKSLGWVFYRKEQQNTSSAIFVKVTEHFIDWRWCTNT